MTTHSTPIVELKGAKEALPPRLGWSSSCDLPGWNQYNTELCEVHLEVDVEAMMFLDEIIRSVLNEEFSLDVTGYEVAVMRREVAKAISTNPDKWARLVRK